MDVRVNAKITGLGDTMETCEFLNVCRFFNSKDTEGCTLLKERLKNAFCQGCFTDCARYAIAITIGLESVPVLMIPTQKEWAEQILLENKSIH